MKLDIILVLLLFLGVFCPETVQAQNFTITEVQPLSFGSFAIVDNTIQRTVTVYQDGSFDYDPEIVAETEAKPGIYDFSGLPPNVTFVVGTNVTNPPIEGGLVLDNTVAMTDGGGGMFYLENINTTDLVTDNSGEGRLYIGATLKSSGLGGIYDSGAYNGSFDLTLFF